MLARLHTLAAGLSLLILVSTVVLWPTSYLHPYGVCISLGARDMYVDAVRDAVSVVVLGNPQRPHFGIRPYFERSLESGMVFVEWDLPVFQPPDPSGLRVAGLRMVRSPFVILWDQPVKGMLNARGLARAEWLVEVPWWLLILAALPAPLLWYRHRILIPRRRRKAGLCIACGYDLRASTERCPECGTPIPASTVAANPTHLPRQNADAPPPSPTPS